MVVVDFLFAFLVALLLSVAMVTALGWGLPGRHTPWAEVLLLFFILFLATWAGGVWVRPVGPALWGVHWLGFLLAGLIIATVVAALTPKGRAPRWAGWPSSQVASETQEERAAFGVFLWLLLVVLTAAILARYLWTPL